LKDTYGSATLITDSAQLPSNLENVDAVILSPSVCQSTSQVATLCSPSSTVLRNLKTGVVAIGSGMVWKQLGLTNAFSRFYETEAHLRTIDINTVLSFPSTLATYTSESTSQIYLKRSKLWLFSNSR
jgi:hypothetical protein